MFPISFSIFIENVEKQKASCSAAYQTACLKQNFKVKLCEVAGWRITSIAVFNMRHKSVRAVWINMEVKNLKIFL